MEVENCEKVIAVSWKEGLDCANMSFVINQILVCSQKLKVWNKQTFGSVHKQIRQSILQLQASDPHCLRIVEHQVARNKLQSLLKIEEIL